MFLDVGANVGVHTLRACSVASRVIALEPHPVNAQLLRWNLALNDIKNVDVIQLALLDKSASSSIGDRLNEAKLGQPGQHTVACVSLDSIASSWDKLDVVKIDVEGVEALVLRGGRETLRRLKPHLIVECHYTGHHVSETLLEDVESELREIGYEWKMINHESVSWGCHIDARWKK